MERQEEKTEESPKGNKQEESGNEKWEKEKRTGQNTKKPKQPSALKTNFNTRSPPRKLHHFPILPTHVGVRFQISADANDTRHPKQDVCLNLLVQRHLRVMRMFSPAVSSHGER